MLMPRQKFLEREVNCSREYPAVPGAARGPVVHKFTSKVEMKMWTTRMCIRRQQFVVHELTN